MKVCVCIPDSHVPFECLKSFKLLFKVIDYIKKHKTLELEMILILGDFLDMYGLSLYDKDVSLTFAMGIS